MFFYAMQIQLVKILSHTAFFNADTMHMPDAFRGTYYAKNYAGIYTAQQEIFEGSNF